MFGLRKEQRRDVFRRHTILERFYQRYRQQFKAVIANKIPSGGGAMDTYLVRPDSQKPTRKQRAIAVLCFGGIYFILMLGWQFFRPTSTERNRGLLSIAVVMAW
jgi:hypothetical protein